MPTSVTSGYHAQFDQFVQFAEGIADAKQSKAVIRAQQPGDLSTRTISTATSDKVGGFAALFRKRTEKDANNVTRDLFQQAVAEMFGGKEHIPASVLKAMEMGNFNKTGKPLSARRIMAVKAAIDDAIAQKVDFLQKVATAGFWETDEIVNANRAANFYMVATKCTPDEAFAAISTPGSKANRLMLYGGRFMEDVKSFSQGLKLIEDFETWFDDMHQQSRSANPASFTAAHLNGRMAFAPTERLGLERFVFEGLAADAHVDLSKSPEEIFGMQNNATTRFICRGLSESATPTLLQIPPEKRAVVYNAIECLWPLDAATVKIGPPRTGANIALSRILLNFDKVQTLMNKGTLNVKTLYATCFRDIPLPSGTFSLNDIEQFSTDCFSTAMDLALKRKLGKDPSVELSDEERSNGLVIHGEECLQYATGVGMTMIEYGCSFKEALVKADTGKQFPRLQYAATYSCPLSELNETTGGALATITKDLSRATAYGDKAKKPHPDNPHFSVTFPGASGSNRLDMTNCDEDSQQAKQQAQAVRDRVVDLCRPIHTRQAFNVMYSLTQSALTTLRGGLQGLGVSSDEHAAVDFSLSRDDFTGAVTIRYDSPEGCPVKFTWTTTVDVYGKITSTPLQVL